MNKTQIVLFLFLFPLLGTLTFADTKEKAVELMKVMEVRKQIDIAMKQVEGFSDKMIEAQNLDPKIKEAAKTASKKSISETLKVMQEIKWENIFADIYTKVFTEEELQGLIDFYKSPLGKKMLEKQPELMAATMNKMQAEMSKFMPKIQEATMSALKEAQQQNQSD